MTAPQLLQDLRLLGVGFRVVGDRLLYGPLARVPVELREEITRHRSELLHLNHHPDAYSALGCSELAARVRDAWPWIADHRPDLFDRVTRADQGSDATDLAAFEAALCAAAAAFDAAHPKCGAVRVHIPSIDQDVWVIGDAAEVETFPAPIRADGDERAALSAADAAKLAGLPRELIDAAVTALAVLGGKVVDSTIEVPPLEPREGFGMYVVYADGVPVRVFGDARRGVAIGAKPGGAVPDDRRREEVARGAEAGSDNNQRPATSAGRSRGPS